MIRILIGIVVCLTLAIGVTTKFAVANMQERAAIEERLEGVLKKYDHLEETYQRAVDRAETLDRILLQRNKVYQRITKENSELEKELTTLRSTDEESKKYLDGVIPDSVIGLLQSATARTEGGDNSPSGVANGGDTNTEF